MEKIFLNRNENYCGPSLPVLKAVRNAKPQYLNMYIDGYYNSILLDALSKKFKLSNKQIALNYGGEDFFRAVFNCRVKNVLTSQFHFYYHDEYFKSTNIKLHTFKMYEKSNDWFFDIDDLVKQYKKIKPEIILIASPNNPTGNILKYADILKILKTISSSTVFIFDNAYYGFDNASDYQKIEQLLKKFPNFVILRTFSKFYALAGLRASYALGSQNMKKMLGYQDYYLGMSRIMENTALAALNSEKYYKASAQTITKEREKFITSLKKMKFFKPYNSGGNFVLVRINQKAVKTFKKALSGQRIVLYKDVTDDLIRVTVNKSEYMAKFVEILKKIDKSLS